MLHVIPILAVAALASYQNGGQAAKLPRSRLINTMDNEISLNEPQTAPAAGRRNFVEIELKPQPARQRAGEAVRLTCDAAGLPAPQVRWLKNDMPILEEDPETNELVQESATSLASVRSVLLLRTVSSNKQDVYTCVAVAGAKSTEASATVYNDATIPAYSLNAVNRRLLAEPLKPVITTYVKSILDNYGATVVLPCRARGQPVPDVYWLDPEHNLVLDRDDSRRVLESGDLVISSLSWSDMGTYTCVAKNAFGKDSVPTFLYPVSEKRTRT